MEQKLRLKDFVNLVDTEDEEIYFTIEGFINGKYVIFRQEPEDCQPIPPDLLDREIIKIYTDRYEARLWVTVR